MRGIWHRLLIAVLVVASLAGASTFPWTPAGVQAAGTVGSGTPASCDEAALDTALTDGGLVSFSCGAAPHTIELTEEKVISDDTQIDGGELITLDGQGSTQIFFVNSGITLDLENITLSNGDATFGGAIRSANGTVAITNSILSSNAAVAGGGIYNTSGTLTITHSTLSSNVAVDGSGIYSESGGTVEITDSTLSDNEARVGSGIYSTGGTLTVTDSTLSDNEAEVDGGGIYSAGGTLTVTGSTLSGNQAGNGGAIYNSNGTLTTTDSTLNGNQAGSGGSIYNGNGTLIVTDSTLNDNQTVEGGGIFNLNNSSATITNSTISGNNGGGIFNSSTSALTVTGSTLSSNGPTGGGISNSGTATISDSTLNDNSAATGAGIMNFGTITVTNSTISGNSAGTQGGGIFHFEDAFTITNSTISGNAAESGGGNIAVNSGTVKLQATIIANSPSGGNCFGNPVTSQDENLSDDASCNLTEVGDLNSTDPLLGPLQNNGGPTATHLPGAGSRAIDAAPSCPTAVDQRGIIRPQGVTCDIGAVEARPPILETPLVTPSPSFEGQSVTASASFTNPEGTGSATCTVDYGDGSGPQAGVVDGLICAGPAYIYLDDDPSGTPSDDYTVTVAVTDPVSGTGSSSTSHTVNNVAPVINDTTTNAPAPQGQPVAVTVNASDIGVNDILTYSFDCDDDGIYETPGVGNRGDCLLDPAAAVSAIGVQVLDDDLGVAVETVEVSQTVVLCGNSWTGALYLPTGSSCPTGTLMLTLPAAYPTTLCYSSPGSLIWKPGGNCGSNWTAHVAPLDGPLTFCASLWTKQLSHSWSGACGTYETPGVIPGTR